MTETLILVCNRCGGLLLAKANTKTRTCPYCGVTVKIYNAKRINSAPSAQEASTLLKKLKSFKQSSQKEQESLPCNCSTKKNQQH